MLLTVVHALMDDIPWKLEFDLLSMCEMKIITQLRTEHINLNWCNHQLKHYTFYRNQPHDNKMIVLDNEHNNGRCADTNCDDLETVEHILEKHSNHCWLDLQQYMEHIGVPFTLKNALFPPTNTRW
eukprot:777760_1